mmetsp:Transcript_2221/g.2162  ORF Transcript_2221/g.2162 Transcript_2221/m.2162 type:complete len:86 (+) Transcript_2221:548-805(+)
MVQNLDFQEAKSDYELSDGKEQDIEIQNVDEIKKEVINREIYQENEDEDMFERNMNNAGNLRRNSTEMIRRGSTEFGRMGTQIVR